MRNSSVMIHGFIYRLGLIAAGALLAAGLMVGLGAVPATAADFDGIAGAPAANGGVDQSRSRFSYQVDAGQVVSDEYLVQNTGTTAQSITVYATDAFNSNDGAYSLLDGGVSPKDVGRWVTFDNGADQISATLEPGASQVIPFTVTTPADASPGDHAGGIVVSAMSPSGQISLDRRVAIRLYVRVKGELQTGLTIGSIATSYKAELNPFSGTTAITITLNNTGNVALGATTVSRIRGIFGIPLSGISREEIPEMLPGSTRTLTITVPGVGPWVYLNPQVDLAATIDKEAINPGVLPTASREANLLVVPWGILLIVVLASLAWFIVRFSRKRGAQRAADWMEYTEAEAQRKAREG
jgi:dihydroorotate dehydrogenase (fumarate)